MLLAVMVDAVDFTDAGMKTTGFSIREIMVAAVCDVGILLPVLGANNFACWGGGVILISDFLRLLNSSCGSGMLRSVSTVICVLRFCTTTGVTSLALNALYFPSIVTLFFWLST